MIGCDVELVSANIKPYSYTLSQEESDALLDAAKRQAKQDGFTEGYVYAIYVQGFIMGWHKRRREERDVAGRVIPA